MSVSIVGGNELWQWDTDIYINVPSDVNSIEFRYSCNRAVVGEIVDGKCRVFDSLLQKPGNLVVYSTKNNRTVEKVSFKINERPKPDGYVYTEEDVLVWTVLREDIDELSNSLAQTNENLQSVEDKVNDMQISLDGNYNSLANKPMINGQELVGDKSSNQFGLQPEDYKVAITGYALSLNSNRSYHEILRAFDSGKRVYATYMGKQYPLYEQQGSAFIFALINYAVNPAKASVVSINSQNIVSVKDYNLTALAPNKLKFTGAVTGEFDGSQEVTVDIPQGGGGGIIEETDPTVPDWAKQPSKPTYTAEEVGALPANTVIPTMPTKTSQLTNDSGFLTSESDPTVPSWAKASTKPTYTASEVGALPASRGADIDANASEINQLKADMADKLSEIPQASETELGGIKASPKTDSDTVEVRIGSDMKLYVPAQENTGGGVEVDAELREYYTTAKQAIKESIINKGVAVSDEDSLASYADKIAEIPSTIEPTEDIPMQTKLVATELQETTGIKLVWEDVSAHGYLIKRKQTGEVTSTADGTTVYNGIGTEFIDTTATRGNTYYYRIFPYNAKNQYNAVPAGQEVAVTYKDRAGQVLVGNLAIDDVIKFGEYEGVVLEWQVKDTVTAGRGYISLACKQNIGSIMYDAQENASDNPNPITARKNQGNNRWGVSNVRQLLNSEADKGAWFTKQHEYDVAPDYAGSKAGFLKDFTAYEKNILYKKTNVCILDVNDGGGTESMLDTIWLPSTFEIGSEITLPLENDHIFNGFSDNGSRAYQSNWWTRTINNASSSAPNTASHVRLVFSSGALYSYNASNVVVAVRPFCSLPTSAYVRWSDGDNAYVFADDSLRNA